MNKGNKVDGSFTNRKILYLSNLMVQPNNSHSNSYKTQVPSHSNKH